MTVYELSIVNLIHPEGMTIHAVAGTDDFARDENGALVLCGLLHDEKDDDWMECPVASRWTICR